MDTFSGRTTLDISENMSPWMYFEDSGRGFRVGRRSKTDQNEHVYDFWAHFIYISS